MICRMCSVGEHDLDRVEWKSRNKDLTLDIWNKSFNDDHDHDHGYEQNFFLFILAWTCIKFTTFICSMFYFFQIYACTMAVIEFVLLFDIIKHSMCFFFFKFERPSWWHVPKRNRVSNSLKKYTIDYSKNCCFVSLPLLYLHMLFSWSFLESNLLDHHDSSIVTVPNFNPVGVVAMWD